MVIEPDSSPCYQLKPSSWPLQLLDTVVAINIHLQRYEKHCSHWRDVEAVRSEAAEGKRHVWLLRRSKLRRTVNGACWLAPPPALCFPCKIICVEKESSSTLSSRGSILHGLIWSMVSASPRPRWDLRSHQAHAFERHLFIFRMQMQPTSKALSCGEHTMWMCWSALPGGWGPTYVRFKPPHPPPLLSSLNPDGHTQTRLSKEAGDREASLTPNHVYSFCCFI